MLTKPETRILTKAQLDALAPKELVKTLSAEHDASIKWTSVKVSREEADAAFKTIVRAHHGGAWKGDATPMSSAMHGTFTLHARTHWCADHSFAFFEGCMTVGIFKRQLGFIGQSRLL